MKKIVTLWPKWTYSNHVAHTIVSDDMRIDLVIIPSDLIDAVKKISGDIIAGSLGNMAVIQKIPESTAWIVPIHNTHGKMVNLAPIGIYQLKLKYPTTRIIWWYSLQVDHVLVSNNHTNLSNLKHIYSHPQAISQCSENIAKLHRKTTLHNTPSTTSHIPYLQDWEAVICSEKSARDNGLYILNDSFWPQNNITSFAVVSIDKELKMKDFNWLSKDKAMIVLTFPDQKWTLLKATKILAKAWVNMNSIDSQIKTPGQVDFVVVCDNHIDWEWLRLDVQKQWWELEIIG